MILSSEMKTIIAIANFSYLATIGEFISHEAEEPAGVEYILVEKMRFEFKANSIKCGRNFEVLGPIVLAVAGQTAR